jgi:hypothetical protein
LLFAILVIRIAAQRRLLRIFIVPGLIAFSGVYFFAATHSLALFKCGVFLAALLLNGPFSFWGNYLPRIYPTHLRGTGESLALNVGARFFGASAALLTTQVANVMPGGGAAARLAYSAGTVAVLAYMGLLTAALAAMNAEDSMIGIPEAPDCLRRGSSLFRIDSDLGLLAKSRDHTHNSGIDWSLDGWSANLRLRHYGRIVRHTPKNPTTVIVQGVFPRV